LSNNPSFIKSSRSHRITNAVQASKLLFGRFPFWNRITANVMSLRGRDGGTAAAGCLSRIAHLTRVATARLLSWEGYQLGSKSKGSGDGLTFTNRAESQERFAKILQRI
jgi:hypothetical protein